MLKLHRAFKRRP